MNYKIATINSIKDDVIKNKILITIEVSRDRDNLKVAEELATYCGADAQDMEVTFAPRQISLFPSKE